MLLRHGLHYLLARGLPGILNFAAIAIYTRLVNADEYGAYALTIATVAAVDALLLHWLRLALLRFLPKTDGEPGAAISAILRLFVLIISGVVLLACVGAFALVRDPFVRQLVLLGTIILAVQGAFELTVERERSRLSPERYGMYAWLKSGAGLAVGTALAAGGLGARGLLIAAVVSMVLPLSVLGGVPQWVQAFRHPFDRGVAVAVARYGLPLAITSSLAFVVSSSDRFMLAAFIDQAAAGRYAAGYDLAQFTLGMLLSIVNLAAYPLVVAAFERSGPEAARVMLRRTLRLLLAVGLPATVGLAMLAGNVAHVMVGAEFKAAAAVVIPGITVAAFLAGMKAFYLDLSFQLQGRTAVQAWIVLGAAVLNVGLNFVLIPVLGILGAVYATVAAQLFALVLAWWLGRGVFEVPLPDASLWPLAFATAVMALVLLPLRGWGGAIALAAQVLFGAGVYAASLWGSDRRFFKELASRGD